MYYIDSLTKQVIAFDYELETGEISNPRVVVQIPEGQGIPDGMTTDAETLDQLFITSAWQGLNPQQILEQPNAGAIFSVQ